jgi:hypothetical protein
VLSVFILRDHGENERRQGQKRPHGAREVRVVREREKQKRLASSGSGWQRSLHCLPDKGEAS